MGLRVTWMATLRTLDMLNSHLSQPTTQPQCNTATSWCYAFPILGLNQHSLAVKDNLRTLTARSAVAGCTLRLPRVKLTCTHSNSAVKRSRSLARRVLQVPGARVVLRMMLLDDGHRL
jgi:hypothetical protein